MTLAAGESLDVTGAAFRSWLETVGQHLGRFLDALPSESAAPAVASERTDWSVAASGRPLADVLEQLFGVGTAGLKTAGPGYLAYVPGGGLPAAALGALIGDVVNRFTGIAVGAPEFVAIETAVIEWRCRSVGLPAGAFGVLTTGGSMANFTATVAARVARLPEDFLSGTLYTSSEAHHSVLKAARLAGFPRSAIRVIGTDARRRLRIDLLQAAVAADREAGRQPFMVVGAAGTTNTGAVDPLSEIADLAEREQLWFHVDGAYGGSFVLTERGRTRLSGIERADSVTLDPHKGFFLPYGTGALLVRDKATLERAHGGDEAAYLPTGAVGAVDFSSLTGELSRDFRGLRLWLPLAMSGAQAFTSALDEKLDLTALAQEGVLTLPHVELVAPADLSLFAFRLSPPGLSAADRDALNHRFLDRINARGRVYLSGTELELGYVLRICVLSFRTHHDRIAAGIEDLHAAAREVLGDR